MFAMSFLLSSSSSSSLLPPSLSSLLLFFFFFLLKERWYEYEHYVSDDVEVAVARRLGAHVSSRLFSPGMCQK